MREVRCMAMTNDKGRRTAGAAWSPWRGIASPELKLVSPRRTVRVRGALGSEGLWGGAAAGHSPHGRGTGWLQAARAGSLRGPLADSCPAACTTA